MEKSRLTGLFVKTVCSYNIIILHKTKAFLYISSKRNVFCHHSVVRKKQEVEKKAPKTQQRRRRQPLCPIN